jgi:hypothetical protein
LNTDFSYSAFFICILLASTPCASSTAGVHGPGVNEGESSMQLRLSLSPNERDDEEDQWAYRLHYQQSFNDRIRGRLVVQYRDRGTFQYDYSRAELLYNFKKKAKDGAWSSGVRFDIRQRRSDNPESFAMHWTNQWNLENGVVVRGIIVGIWEFGSDRAFNGTAIETRSSIGKKLDNGLNVGLEIYNVLGRAGHFGSFDSQNHQMGPTLSGSYGSVKYHVRYLAGISDGARNHNFGFRINKSF